MEISIDRADLAKELSITQGVIERKSTVPILSHFLFEASGSNLLITATDLELSLRTFCPAKVEADLNGLKTSNSGTVRAP
jgi:DNA polymerase-3 subunit beta